MRKARLRRFLTLLSVMAFFAALGTGVTSASAEGTLVRLQNSNSGLCLVVQGNADGARAFQTRCGEFADQLWQRINNSGNLTSSTGGQIRFRNFNSGKCLVVQGTADGAPAFQFTCGSFADQKWVETSKGTDPRSGSTKYSIRNVNSSKCLLVRGSTDGARAVQNQCLNFVDQQWTYI